MSKKGETIMPSTSSSHERQQNWYMSRAFLKLREARYYSRLRKYAEAVCSSYESMEFSLKALCKILDVHFDRKHFVDEFTVAILAEKIGETWIRKKEKLLSILPIILSYSDRLREIARYGVERKDVRPLSPDQIFQEDYCQKVLEDAEVMVDILSQIRKSREWDRSKPLKTGALNGFSVNPYKEKECQPQLSFKDPRIWDKLLGDLKKDKIPKYDVTSILSSEISEEFALVINPYGEAYPESDVGSKDTYEQIKIFIENGGVFINTAGFAFFYSWDHSKGERKPISEERYLLVQESAGKIQIIPELISFQGTLLYRDFGVSVTSDLPNHSGAHEVKPFQTADDIAKFGDLASPSLKEFRAVRSDNSTSKAIPILRAKCDIFGEIYLISAIKFGRGYLLLGGFTMETEEEAKFFAKAVDAFCAWISKQFSVK